MDPRVYRVLENIQDGLQQMSAGIGSLGRGKTPDGRSITIIEQEDAITDHGALDGLTSIVQGTTTIDYNDDHTQYALLAGRPDGQYLYGSRNEGASWGWNPQTHWVLNAEDTGGNTYLTSVGEITNDVPVGGLAMLVVSSSFYNPTQYPDGEDTNWHETMTDNGGTPNTWVKLKEWSTLEGTQTQRVVSVWYTVVTEAISAASTTVTVNMNTNSGTWQMTHKAMEGFWFNVGANATITLVDTTGSAQDDGIQPDALSLDVTGPTLYLRGICARGFSVTTPELFVPSGGFTPFTTDHTDSTGADPTKIQCARGEFKISDEAQESSPLCDGGAANVYDFANVFLAIQLNVDSDGLLNLGSVKSASAANILLQNQTITANMDFFNFRDAGGTSTLSYIDGSDGSFVGNTTLAADFYGTFLESFDALVTESGGTITCTVTNAAGGSVLHARFSDGLYEYTPGTIALTAGTDDSPQGNYVYLLQSNKTLTKDLSGWPDAEHVKIGYFLVPSATFVGNNGCYINQNWNDHQFDSNNMGHVAHLAEKGRMAQGGANYFSGLNGAGTSDYLTLSGTTVDFKMAAGVVYQMHRQTISAVDTSAGDVILVPNWNGDPYHDITNLYDIVADSTGTTIGTNKWFNLTVWAVGNKGGEYCPVMINLPSGFYTTQTDAENDVDGYDNYNVPREYSLDSSTGFLVCRITVQKTGSGWSYGSTVDLRGTKNSVASGGGLAAHDHYYDSANRSTTGLFAEGLSLGNVAPIPTLATYWPVQFDFTVGAAARDVTGLLMTIENTATGSTAGATGIDMTLHSAGTVWGKGLTITRDAQAASITAGTALAPAIELGDVFTSNTVATAQGAALSLISGGVTRAEHLYTLTLHAAGADTTNDALLVTAGAIRQTTDDEGFYTGASSESHIYWDGGSSGMVLDVASNGFSFEIGGVPKFVLAQTLGGPSSTGFSAFPILGNTESGDAGQLIFGHNASAQGVLDYDYANSIWQIQNTWDDPSIEFQFIRGASTELMKLDGDGDLTLSGGGDLYLPTDNARIYWGAGNDAYAYWSGSDLIFITNAVTSAGRLRVASPMFISSNITATSAYELLEVQALANSATEANAALYGGLFETANQAGADRGRNFSSYTGGYFRTRFFRGGSGNDVTWNTYVPKFFGGDFFAWHNGTAAIQHTSLGGDWYGGRFTVQFDKTTVTAMTVRDAWAGYFQTNVSGSGNISFTDLGAGYFTSPAGAVIPTRNYGILVEDVTGGTDRWGINVDMDSGGNSAIQISSDDYLVLEGSASATGDTRLRWNSSSSVVEFDVNGTTEMQLGTDALVIPVKTTTGDPTAVADGHLYLNTADGLLRLRSNGSWHSVATGL